MRFQKCLKKGEFGSGQKTKCLTKYSKPTLVKLGTVIGLTSGGSGPLGDFTGPTTPGTKQW
jgi:hypothetical protein